MTIRFYATTLGEGGWGDGCVEAGVSLEGVRGAALSTIALCFSVAGKALGRHRLHHLVTLLQPILADPKPLGAVVSGGGDDADDGYISSDDEADAEANEPSCASNVSASLQLQYTPSRALTVLVKLLKVSPVLTCSSPSISQ